jgi:hypothetical protein
MNLQSSQEVEVTRRKLRILEEQYEAIRSKSASNEYARELTLRSIRQTINQFKEDIVRFESRIAMNTRTS